MTYVLQIGETAIPYRVRFSKRAKRKRVVVRAEGVEVVAPVGTPLEGRDGVFAFVDARRRWLFDARREIEARRREISCQRWVSGAKLQYRGRWLRLEVVSASTSEIEIVYRNRFRLRVPESLAEERIQWIDIETQDVEGLSVARRVDFDSGDDLQAGTPGGRLGLDHAAECVVVGKRDDAQALFYGGTNNLRWTRYPIGGCGMDMQIYSILALMHYSI